MILADSNECTGCCSCLNSCPFSYIKMIEGKDGFLYPSIDSNLCISCGVCKSSCPVLSNFESCDRINKTYAAFSISDEMKYSSSGGIFFELARFVLSAGGVVFGSSFDEFFNVCHICIATLNDLIKLQGSKYVQSYVGYTFKLAKEYLDKGIKVLFTGTPCQIEGLLFYLKKDYLNLYTQDIVCHGVPSNKLWKGYLNTFHKEIKTVVFRDKSYGWKECAMSINGRKVNKSKSPYYLAFSNNVSLRKSCYKCKFKSRNKRSDLTLGDLWGSSSLVPCFGDNHGVSLVCINSVKGLELFDLIKDKVRYTAINRDDAILFNQSYIKSPFKPSLRDYSLSLNFSKFSKVILKNYKKNYIKKIVSKLKRTFH